MEESIETTPRLEWIPFEGADSYIVEMSTDPGFAEDFTLFTEEVDIPVYTPFLKLWRENPFQLQLRHVLLEGTGRGRWGAL